MMFFTPSSGFSVGWTPCAVIFCEISTFAESMPSLERAISSEEISEFLCSRGSGEAEFDGDRGDAVGDRDVTHAPHALQWLVDARQVSGR